jgi:hypothetical protein
MSTMKRSENGRKTIIWQSSPDPITRKKVFFGFCGQSRPPKLILRPDLSTISNESQRRQSFSIFEKTLIMTPNSNWQANPNFSKSKPLPPSFQSFQNQSPFLQVSKLFKIKAPSSNFQSFSNLQGPSYFFSFLILFSVLIPMPLESYGEGCCSHNIFFHLFLSLFDSFRLRRFHFVNFSSIS